MKGGGNMNMKVLALFILVMTLLIWSEVTK